MKYDSRYLMQGMLLELDYLWVNSWGRDVEDVFFGKRRARPKSTGRTVTLLLCQVE